MPSEQHQHLVAKGERWLRSQGCSVVFADLVANTATGESPDLIGWRGGETHPVSILVEAKVSRQDFREDLKKHFRYSASGMGDWRFYLVPQGLVTVNELPEGWGLLELSGRRILKTYGVPANTQWATRAPFQGAKGPEMEMMFSGLRRCQKSNCKTETGS